MERPILEFRGVSKSFFGTHALRSVSLSLPAGHVLGLVGENGAGKSTLMNVLGGMLQADSGEMLLDGKPLAPRDPRQSAAAGIAMVHQELNLFANLSIAENLFLTDMPQLRSPPGWIRWGELHRRTRELLQAVQLSLDPATPVESLTPGERQLVEIAKALRSRARIVVFDEPTTSLTKPEAERLFKIMAGLRRDGVSIIYISHNLGDVLRLCDWIAVLRDGEVQAVGPKEEFTTERMIALMIGRNLETLFPAREPRPAGADTAERMLEVRGVSQDGVVEDISFTLHRGEVLGISGLMGSGRTELARILFGLDSFQRGEILVRGRPLGRPSPRRCIRRGMALLTEDRAAEGLLREASVEENLALVALDHFGSRRLGLIRSRKVRETAGEMVDRLGIECRGLRQPVKTLSGGNQQKVVLGKWLLSGADVLILDEPTRGVDVGARHEIYQQINRLVGQGAAVVLISSEIEELVGLCDRILVMADGELQADVQRKDFDRSAMLRSALGEERLR
jgi:ribose transport system ATP-binding protein